MSTADGAGEPGRPDSAVPLATVAVVPAFDRGDTVAATVAALTGLDEVSSVVVVDDGSTDDTTSAATSAGASVVRLDANVGKGDAVKAGVAAAPDALRYLLIDADLGSSAASAGPLVDAVDAGAAMSIATFPATGRSRGFGLVKRAAAAILLAGTGRAFSEPLSGQRCVDGALMRSLDLAPRFGLEIALTLDVAARGERIDEIELDLEHRATGRDLAGFVHRGRQGRDLLAAAASRLGWHRVLRSALPSIWRRR